jgi:hypothetical protein
VHGSHVPGGGPAAALTPYVRAIKAEYVGLWYRRFILGHWVQSEGAIYESFDEDVHVVDELPEIARLR